MNEEFNKCVICQEDYTTDDNDNITYTNCCHKFHTICINDWYATKLNDPTCPTCGTPPYVQNIEQLNNYNNRKKLLEEVQRQESLFFQSLSNQIPPNIISDDAQIQPNIISDDTQIQPNIISDDAQIQPNIISDDAQIQPNIISDDVQIQQDNNDVAFATAIYRILELRNYMIGIAVANNVDDNDNIDDVDDDDDDIYNIDDNDIYNIENDDINDMN
jgi:hypothetical protein